MQIKTINQYGEKYSLPPKHSRIGCRAIIVQNGKILLSHEVNTGVYLSPGGGLENGEAPEKCVVREVREETGYVVRVLHPFVNVNEYFYDKVFVSNYFVCEIVGNDKQSLTETEILHGVEPEWIDFEKLSDVRELILETFAEEGAADYIDKARVKAICDTTQKRIKDLFVLSMDETPSELTSTENDVEENIAEDYRHAVLE